MARSRDEAQSWRVRATKLSRVQLKTSVRTETAAATASVGLLVRLLGLGGCRAERQRDQEADVVDDHDDGQEQGYRRDGNVEVVHGDCAGRRGEAFRVTSKVFDGMSASV